MVKQIEELSPEIQVHSLCQTEVFNRREIGVDETGAIERRAARIAEFSCGRIDIAVSIEELVNGVVVQRASAQLIWTIEAVGEINTRPVAAGNEEQRKSRGNFLDYIEFPTPDRRV